MPSEPTALWFDFVDPLSYLLELELGALDSAAAEAVRRSPFELRPPPAPLVSVDDPALAARWAEARSLGARDGIRLEPPSLVPWSRKAHELHLLAQGRGAGAGVRNRLFEAYLLEGRDIGRIDVLVGIAREAGLDASETKAALDVDRYEADVADARAIAIAAGVLEAPTLVRGSARLQGFHNRSRLSTFLHQS